MRGIEQKLLDLKTNFVMKTGLKKEPHKLIDRTFYFVYGDHWISGKITGVGGGPGGELVLYVTSPRFFGLEFTRLEFRDGAWCAVRINESGGAPSIRNGKLILE